jgi:hypothetical protein
MKKLLVVALALVVVGGLSATVRADLTGSATAAVHAKVSANIAVTPQIPIVDAGSIQTGELSVDVPFMVHANTEAVQLWVIATDLWKGDTPLPGSDANKIPLQIAEGVVITPQNAGVYGGGSNVSTLINSATFIGAFPAYEFSHINFESADRASFSHPVTVHLNWTVSDNQQAVGDYGGRVQLNAMVMPSLN